MAKFKEYSGLNLSNINKEILERWQQLDVFHKSIETREGKPSFVFYEGPPSANGMPGIHHVMARAIKDIFCRYKTMQGFQVKRKAGWDTHGLPVELGVEKSLGITKEDIGKKISVDEYNAACRHDVMKYTREWEDLTTKMGYWVDMNDPYITYDNRYIETLWWLLKQLYNKNLLYKGYTIQPYSPAAGTGLSTHELNQPGCYRDVKDTTCVAQFRLPLIPSKGGETVGERNFVQLNKVFSAHSLSFGEGWGGVFFLAWTTTPWTLPSNTALCVGPNIDYVLVKSTNPYSKQECNLILAEALLTQVLGKNECEILGKCKGSDLAGMEYEQLIPWVNPGEGAFRVITGDFVTTEDGTGIVHIAPTFGADDDRVAKQNGVPPMLLIDKDGNRQPMVDRSGKFFTIEDLDTDFVNSNVNTDTYKEFAGRFVKNAYDPTLSEQDETLDVSICIMLKQQGLAYKIEKHTHNYPHCWRTDKPVLYYPLDSWFIRTTACREEMIALNNTINWKPASTGTGRFGKWLENLQDWNLSRSRYWGTPLPIWRTEDGTEEICIGSVEELISEIEKSIKAGFMSENPYKNFKAGEYTAENYDVKNIDLHRPYVDGIVLVSASGKPMKRELDLIDVWFDSGAMPYAQLHYPFENKDLIESGDFFPADFISEGVDQTRGWFFTLHAISTMVRGSVAFKSVISNGLVLDKNGNKMSKRLGNAVDPFSTIEKYGSDPLRWYMMTNASPWDNLKFDIEGIEEVRRKFFGTLYNTYSFFALYANVDNFTNSEAQIPVEKRPEIDRWILSLLNTLTKEVQEHYENYEPTRAGRAISDFVGENLSNWYVRLNRKRYWGGEYDQDKIAAYQTLYTCLETVAKLMAPIAPFFADQLYLDLKAPLNPPSVGDFGAVQSSKPYNTANPLNYEMLKENAKNRRKNPTEAESFLWKNLQSKNLDNYKFRREHIIGDFIVDFVCLSKQLVIEVDGGYHNEENQQELDKLRTEYLNKQGFTVIRFTNESILFDIENTLNAIKVALDQSPLEGDLGGCISVHLADFPSFDASLIDTHLEECMQLAQQTTSMILALRKKAEKKVRQPLMKAVVPAPDEKTFNQLTYVADLVKTEVNIKELEVIPADTEMDNLVKKIKPNFKTLGKKYGKQMKEIAVAFGTLSKNEISEIERNGTYILKLASGDVEITTEDAEIITEDMPGWLVANEGRLTVALDITVTDALLREGIARELVNRIQNIRKSSGYEITDKIAIEIESRPEIETAVQEYASYIGTQTLATSVEIKTVVDNATELDFEDYIVKIKIEKI
ncbi:MAG: isoleucine--tRNA ligase [Paludibacter sp.]|nr:isoleucine--tRNA ligase [Paludibacter sp.]